MADALKPLLSSRPGEKARLWGALESSFRKFSLNFDHILPASIISYDRKANVANVQPLIKVVRVDGITIDRHPLASVPVVSIGGGGFNLNFPLKAGDLGWIMATDRDYSEFMKTLSNAAPNSSRSHKFDDSIFLPDVLRQYTIDPSDATAMVLQAVDSKTRIAIDVGGHIRITAPTDLLVDSPKSIFTGDVIVQKTLTVSQKITGLAGMDITGTIYNNGINVTGHVHIGNGAGNPTGTMK